MNRTRNGFRGTFVLPFLAVALWLGVVALYHTHKPLPDALDYVGDTYVVGDEDLEFVYDLTFTGSDGARIIEQRIFDTVFAAIENAERYVLIDMFLFNSHGMESGEGLRDLSSELSNLLIDKKYDNPDISIDFITDPINTVYGGGESAEIARLLDAGVNVVITDLHRLRDSNFIYSAIWRTVLQWIGMLSQRRWLNHPFSADGKVSLGGYLDLINFKANHRKVVVADRGDGMTTIITSANPHGGSSAHANVALVIRGDFWRSVYETEKGVAEMSGRHLSQVDLPAAAKGTDGQGSVRLLTERRIKEALLDACRSAGPSDSLDLAQFYMSDRDIVAALLEASGKGASVRIILDPNKDAFGYEKNGIPNRQVGSELAEKSRNRIVMRWYDTHGEQFHTKLFIKKNTKALTVITGSANLTRRNLDNYNLELGLIAELDPASPTAEAISDYFDRIWFNRQGTYSVDFDAYRDDSTLKYALYRIQEGLGLGTF